MGNNTGILIAQTAGTYPTVDNRSYGAAKPKVDCSMFVAEVYAKSNFLLPREATAQAAWFKTNGVYFTTFKDLQVGDTAYWDRGNNKFHTGIIVQISPVVQVVHATSYGGKPYCIRRNDVGSTGIIKGWHFKFVGGGRVK